MDLTYKQRLFVSYYVGESAQNATDAARRAGYSWPDRQGYQLLGKTRVKAAIAAKAEAAMPKAEVLARLSEIASGSLEHFIDVQAENAWTLSLAKAKKCGRLRLLKKLKQGKEGPEIEIHDPLSALDKLAKIHGLYDQQPGDTIDLVEIARGMGAKIRDGGPGVDHDGAGAVPG